MMPRPHPETNENRHHRFAQHIGAPRREVFMGGKVPGSSWPPGAKIDKGCKYC